MRNPDKKPHPLVALRMRYHDTYDAVSLFVYVVAIYIWSVTTYPLGRDFEALAAQGSNLPFLARQFFQAEMTLFGTWLPGYHVFNILLLYACVICVYYFTNLTVRGLWWFGTLSASMFLANPVHSEAILNISGVGDLVPCLAGLLALTAYAAQVRKPAPWKFALALVLLLVATVPYAGNATLLFVIVLLELFVARTGERSLARLGTFTVAGIVGLFAHTGDLLSSDMQFSQRFTPLYFLFYPLGFLPKTAVAFHERPWLGWLAAAAVFGLIALIYRKARRPVILFGLLGMAVLRLAPLDRPMDFVSLIGGGQLLLANALFTVGLVALFFRIMDHPKWRISMVGITTTIVIILFAMQFISVRRWHDAGERVAAFQAQAKEAAGEEPLGVLPDYRDYYGAPMNLSDAIAYDTIFSEAIPAVSVLPLRAERTRHRQDVVTKWSSAGGVLALSGKLPNSVDGLFPNPIAVAKAREGIPVSEIAGAQVIAIADATVSIADTAENAVTVVITPGAEPLPEHIVPGPVSE